MMRSVLAMAIATVLVGSMVIEPRALAQQPSTQLNTDQPSRHEGVSAASDDSQSDNPNSDTTNRSDERFLKDFAQINAAEVDKGELAVWKAEDAEVKAFAKQMVDNHSKTIGKVKTIAAETHVAVKEKPDFMQKTKAAFLDINVGASFDRAYMKAMVNEHEKVVEMLEREIKGGHDAAVKQFASDALSDAQTHLQMAQDLRAKVYAYESAKRSLARNDSSGAEKVAANR